MRTDDQLQRVPAVEVLHAIRAEATGVLAPWRDMNAEDLVVVRRIRPERIQHHSVSTGGPFVDFADDLNGLRDPAQVVQLGNGVPDAAMDAKDRSFHQRRDGKELEDVVDTLPDAIAIPSELPRAVGVEAVVHVHQPVLVVPSDQEDPLGIKDLQRKEQGNHITRIGTPVDKVAQEHIVHREDVSTPLVWPGEGVEELQEVQ
mmetsp:Transcript_46038/g.107645  ORF Transcript_46038/g.107645 Transcript_46038/m.107645 type:complete len:202 (+) Transcript_46038:384-989(+)